jgi:hypothetical protein
MPGEFFEEGMAEAGLPLTERLAAGERLGEWLAELDQLGPPPTPLQLPSEADALTLLRRVETPPDDSEEIVATLPSRERDADRWHLLERAFHRLTVGLGEDSDFRPSGDGKGPWGIWPALPVDLGGSLFYAHLFLAALPVARAWHEAVGIDPDDSWATLSNYGRSVELHRRKHGVVGLDFPPWLVLHVRGGLFHLGRLQFRRGTTWWTADETAAARAPFQPGDRVLDLHVPATGPLTPASIDDSFNRARRFFARCFPRDDSSYGVCGSWLLDPQLAGYLPGEANIVRFQRRFQLLPEWEMDADAAVIEFVFQRAIPSSLDDLPQDTALQRAVVRHLRDGGHWVTRRGWCPLGTDAATGGA